MKGFLVAIFLIALSLLVTPVPSAETSTFDPPNDENIVSISLSNYREGEAVKQRLTFAPASNFTIHITNISIDMSFLILQVHTYQYNVTLSYDKYLNKAPNNSTLFGSNIGFFVKPKTTGSTQVFLENDNVRPVEALLVVVPYKKNAPIPGGCNMEFNIEVAPYQKLLVNDAIVTVDLQPASLPPTNNESERSCEKHPVRQDAYRVYLAEQDYSAESYFNAIASMLTAEDIMRNGEKIPPPITASSLRRIYSVYPGTGAVYAAVATYEGRSAAYVPIFTYGCNYVLYPEDCQLLNSTMSKIVCGVIFVAGFLCVFLGHIFQFYEPLVIQSVFVGTIGYTLAKLIGSFEVSTNLGISIGAAVLVVVALYVLTACTKLDFAVLTTQINFGCLCSAIYFFAKGNEENNWIYWSIYLGILLVCLIIPVVTPCCIVVLTNAILGSSLMILSIDYMAGSSLKYIVINVIRRITVPEFKYAILSPPFEAKEISLVVFWILLAIYRVAKEYCHNICCSFRRQNSDSTRPLLSTRKTRILVYMK